MTRTVLISVFLLSCNFAALPAQPAGDADAVVYEVKWREAAEITQLIKSVLGPETRVDNHAGLDVLVVRGTPAQQAVVRDLLERYDTPPQNIEFQFYLVKASRSASGLKDGVPGDVARVIGEIGALTRYNGFELVDSPVLRVLESQSGTRIQGGAALAYELTLDQVSVVGEAGAREIKVGRCSVNTAVRRVEGDPKPAGSPGLFTGLAIPDRGLVVLGASGMSGSDDVALVMVIRATVIDRAGG